jgi:hypothetical protein
VVRAATPAGRRSAAEACECTPPSRNSARCGSRAGAPRRHPHSRGCGQIVITAHGPFRGALAAIDTAGSLPTRSVSAESLNGRAMAAQGRMISIGRGSTAGREMPARLVTFVQALSRAAGAGRQGLPSQGKRRPRLCRTAKCAAAEQNSDAAGGGRDPAQGPPLEALARCRFDSALDQQVSGTVGLDDECVDRGSVSHRQAGRV